MVEFLQKFFRKFHRRTIKFVIKIRRYYNIILKKFFNESNIKPENPKLQNSYPQHSNIYIYSASPLKYTRELAPHADISSRDTWQVPIPTFSHMYIYSNNVPFPDCYARPVHTRRRWNEKERRRYSRVRSLWKIMEIPGRYKGTTTFFSGMFLFYDLAWFSIRKSRLYRWHMRNYYLVERSRGVDALEWLY